MKFTGYILALSAMALGDRLVQRDNVPGYELVVGSRQNSSIAQVDPVKQSYGYLNVGPVASKHMYFSFFEARSNPVTAPLVIWLGGGPRCSAMSDLFFENGPVKILPNMTLVKNPYSWNTRANLLYVDQPGSTGFSDVAEPESMRDSAEDFYSFLELFLSEHPEFRTHDIHLAGESYAGHYVPAFTTYAMSRVDRSFNITSMIMGSAFLDPANQIPAILSQVCANERGPVKGVTPEMCKGMNTTLPRCQKYINKCYQDTNSTDCTLGSLYCQATQIQPLLNAKANLYDVSRDCASSSSGLCYPEYDRISQYLSRPEVRKSLGINTNTSFHDCDASVNHNFMFNGDWLQPYSSLVNFLVDWGIPTLVYAGDNDALSGWQSTDAWTRDMRWSRAYGFTDSPLKPWITHQGKAGETRTRGALTALRIFDAGHMVSHDQPEAVLELLNNWLAGNYDLSTRKPFQFSNVALPLVLGSLNRRDISLELEKEAEAEIIIDKPVVSVDLEAEGAAEVNVDKSDVSLEVEKELEAEVKIDTPVGSMEAEAELHLDKQDILLELEAEAKAEVHFDKRSCDHQKPRKHKKRPVERYTYEIPVVTTVYAWSTVTELAHVLSTVTFLSTQTVTEQDVESITPTETIYYTHMITTTSTALNTSVITDFMTTTVTELVTLESVLTPTPAPTTTSHHTKRKVTITVTTKYHGPTITHSYVPPTASASPAPAETPEVVVFEEVIEDRLMQPQVKQHKANEPRTEETKGKTTSEVEEKTRTKFKTRTKTETETATETKTQIKTKPQPKPKRTSEPEPAHSKPHASKSSIKRTHTHSFKPIRTKLATPVQTAAKISVSGKGRSKNAASSKVVSKKAVKKADSSKRINKQGTPVRKQQAPRAPLSKSNTVSKVKVPKYPATDSRAPQRAKSKGSSTRVYEYNGLPVVHDDDSDLRDDIRGAVDSLVSSPTQFADAAAPAVQGQIDAANDALDDITSALNPDYYDDGDDDSDDDEDDDSDYAPAPQSPTCNSASTRPTATPINTNGPTQFMSNIDDTDGDNSDDGDDGDYDDDDSEDYDDDSDDGCDDSDDEDDYDDDGVGLCPICMLKNVVDGGCCCDDGGDDGDWDDGDDDDYDDGDDNDDYDDDIDDFEADCPIDNCPILDVADNFRDSMLDITDAGREIAATNRNALRRVTNLVVKSGANVVQQAGNGAANILGGAAEGAAQGMQNLANFLAGGY